MSTITLQNFRVGSDLTVKVRLKDGGVAIDWSTLSGIRAVLYSDAQSSIAGRCDVTVDGEDPTLLVCRYAATKMQYLGVNRIVVSAKYMGMTKTYDKPAFTFVRWTEDQAGEEITIEDPEVTVEIDVEDVSSSILQEAVDAAFFAADRANEAAEAAEHMVDIHTGPKGDKGDTGETPDISIGTVTTVEPGTPAAASMGGTPEAPVLNLSIPKGAVGATPNFTVGTVTTGQPGTPVVITITGTAEAPVLNVTIPQGLKGDTGVSADYPITIHNGLDSDATDEALAAAQGKILDGKVSQLEAKVDDISTGKYYGYYATASDLPEDVAVDGFAYVGSGPTYTIYNCVGGVWTSSDIAVNQSPIGNEEDIDQNEDGKLQFANRVYNAQQPNGMGYKILRKDATFASQVTDTNTIYEIRYDFALNGGSVTIPDGCELRFCGGRILDGEITFTNTQIDADSEVFVGVLPYGNVKGIIKSALFSNARTSFYTFSFLLNCGADEIVFTKGETYTIPRNITVTNLHGVLDLNGCTFQYTYNDGGIFITLSGCSYLHIKNGTFIGTQDTRTTDTQYSHGIAITPSCHDIEISNCSFSKFAGDCIYISGMSSAQGSCPEQIEIHNCKFGNCVRQQISIISGISITIHDCDFYKDNNENVLYTNSVLASIDIEPNESYQIIKDIRIYGNTMSSKTISAWELSHGVSIIDTYSSIFSDIDIHDNFMSNMFGAFVVMTPSLSAEILVHDNVFAEHSQSNTPASHGGTVPNIQNYAFTLSRNTKFFNNIVKNLNPEATLNLFYSPSSETKKRDIQNCLFNNIARISVTACHFNACTFENSSVIGGTISKTVFDNCLFNGITFTANTSANDSEFNDCSFDGCTSNGTIFTPTRTSFKRCNFNGGLRVAYITQQCSFSKCYFNLSGVTGTVIDRTALDGLQYYCNITECVFEITEQSFASTIISDGIRAGSSNHAPLRMGDNTVKVKEGVVLNAVNWTLFNVPSDAQIDTVRMVNFPSYSQVSQTWGVNAMTIIISEKSKGSTASRPTNKIVGFQYFDTDLGKMIVWNGTAWVNMDGTALS